MPRRRTSLAEDLVELAALLPWWAGVLLALVSYLLLHRMAVQPLAVPPGANQVGAIIGASMGRAAASAGQYVLPCIFMLGAVVSALGRHKRKALIDDATGAGAAQAIERMQWREFEMLVAERFRRQGFRVSETGRNAY